MNTPYIPHLHQPPAPLPRRIVKGDKAEKKRKGNAVQSEQ
jgi:hypothetical protein